MTDRAAPLDPDMPAQQLRLHLGEMTAGEERVARAAIRWANSRHGAAKFIKEMLLPEIERRLQCGRECIAQAPGNRALVEDVRARDGECLQLRALILESRHLWDSPGEPPQHRDDDDNPEAR